jgi:hypothetical protein
MTRRDRVPNKYAALALDEAMGHLVLGAHPWTTHPNDVAWFKKKFEDDFNTEITDPATFLAWRPIVARLFHHVGSAGAFLAEGHQKNVEAPPGMITRDELIVAIYLVRVVICGDKAGKRGRICSQVDFLKAPRDLLKEWKRLKK